MNVKILSPETGLAISILAIIVILFTVVITVALLILGQSIVTPVCIAIGTGIVFVAKRLFVR